jgi:tRNA 2-selenouridine synthase
LFSLLPVAEVSHVYQRKLAPRFIDVRAPSEFKEGHLPNSVNLPLLDDEERALVGTAYKKQGREAAIELGHRLVSGNNKTQKINAWMSELRQHPQALITCFRGGLRSQITQQWLSELGCHQERLQGGYKAARFFLRRQLDQQVDRPIIPISGCTGSGKTELIRALEKSIDLEGLANHRGSAFGFISEQPSQACFENLLSVDLIQKSQLPFLFVEDESRMIGKIAQPESLFKKIRSMPVIFIDEPPHARAERIFKTYFAQAKDHRIYDYFLKALSEIRPKLGGLMFSEISKDLLEAKNESLPGPKDFIWIGKLLKHYYDPLYLKSLKKRDPKVLFQGNWLEVFEFCENTDIHLSPQFNS